WLGGVFQHHLVKRGKVKPDERDRGIFSHIDSVVEGGITVHDLGDRVTVIQNRIECGQLVLAPRITWRIECEGQLIHGLYGRRWFRNTAKLCPELRRRALQVRQDGSTSMIDKNDDTVRSFK